MALGISAVFCYKLGKQTGLKFCNDLKNTKTERVTLQDDYFHQALDYEPINLYSFFYFVTFNGNFFLWNGKKDTIFNWEYLPISAIK